MVNLGIVGINEQHINVCTYCCLCNKWADYNLVFCTFYPMSQKTGPLLLPITLPIFYTTDYNRAEIIGNRRTHRHTDTRLKSMVYADGVML